ncbi:hypothetical protein FACS189434_08780 [Bacteroidia bacterium]|nr:hypothetical protein FACS189434_08780 [Bacteroidia bacterium]
MLFISICLITNSCGGQTNKITDSMQKDINRLLPAGEVMVDVMDSINQNQRQQELMQKFQTAVQQNYDWFVDYMKTVPTGQPMPYHKNLGLTESEYAEMQSSFNDVELFSSGKEKVTIQKENNIIQFKASGKLELLNYLKIDLNNNIVTFLNYQLSFSNTANITTETNALKSKWKGYNWKMEEPKDIDWESIKDLQTINIKQYKFTLGQLKKNNKTWLYLKGREIEKGENQVNFELSIIF